MRLRLFAALAFILGGSALGLIAWQALQLKAAREHQLEAGRTLRELRSRLRAAQLSAPRAGAAPEPAAPTKPVTVRPGVPDNQAIAGRDVVIADLRRQLGNAQNDIGRLNERIALFDDQQRKSASSANERFATAQTDWQTRLTNVEHQLELAQSEARATRDRLADKEKANAKLKEDNKDLSVRSAEISRLLADLQDLERRRDQYLTSALRRYRDITGQFRAMSGMLDSSREPSSNSLNGPALTRIQSTIALAEDDLRQLHEFNAQAQQVERKLAKR